MLHLFIVNPVAGRGKALKQVKLIKTLCKEEKIDFKIIVTKHPKHATEIAKEYSEKDCIVYSVGGDGTLFEVINGLVNTNIPVCMVPARFWK